MQKKCNRFKKIKIIKKRKEQNWKKKEKKNKQGELHRTAKPQRRGRGL